MHSNHILYPTNKQELYPLLESRIRAFTNEVPHLISNLANISVILGSGLTDINWVGFYLIPKHFPKYFPLDKIAGKENMLIVGPFQGLPACTEIAIGKGVCGTCVEMNQIMLVPDVHAFPGHIACDSASNSEIVLPLHNRNGDVVGVLDIDSPIFHRFDEEDKIGLEKIARVIETIF